MSAVMIFRLNAKAVRLFPSASTAPHLHSKLLHLFQVAFKPLLVYQRMISFLAAPETLPQTILLLPP